MMSSVFTKIIDRSLPAYILAEDEYHIAILDIRPLKKGHALVIPKREEDYILDLSASEFTSLWAFAQSVAKKIEKIIPCERMALLVLGMEVAHAHIHLIPIDKESDIHFDKPGVQLTGEEFEELANQIQAI